MRPPGLCQSQHHQVRAHTSVHHPFTSRGDKPQTTPMVGTCTNPRTGHKWRFEEPKQTDTGSAAGPSLGIEFGGFSVFVGISVHPMAHSMFGSRYFWLNYSASQSSINCYWITLRGKNKIFLWLQRAPDQNLIILLFLDGEDLKLKIKTQAGMWFPDLFVFSVVSFFNWNNPEDHFKRKKDPCGKYLFIHLLSCTFFVKHSIF